MTRGIIIALGEMSGGEITAFETAVIETTIIDGTVSEAEDRLHMAKDPLVTQKLGLAG